MTSYLLNHKGSYHLPYLQSNPTHVPVTTLAPPPPSL